MNVTEQHKTHGVPEEVASAETTDDQTFAKSPHVAKNNAESSLAELQATDSSLSSATEWKPLETDRQPWKEHFFRLGPLSGLACLMIAVISMLVSLGILLGSRGMAVAAWTVEPSAILAICTAVANQAMRYAAFQGVMVAWWLGALRGSTIKKLHTDWMSGMTLVGAAKAGPRMGFLGLACIFSTLVALDGPLLQKATHVEYAPIDNSPINLHVSVLPELPTHLFSGWMYGNQTGSNHFRNAYQFNHTIPTPHDGQYPNNINIVMENALDGIQGIWLRDDPMIGAVHGCPKDRKCKLLIRAPALITTACTSYSIPVNYHDIADAGSVTSYTHAAPLNRDSFLIDISLIVGGEKEKINVIVGTAHTEDCVGTLDYEACTLEAAVADYEVIAHGDGLRLLNAGSPTIVALSNNTHVSHVWNPTRHYYNSSLAGIVALASQKWESQSVQIRNPGDPSVYVTSWGPAADAYLRYEYLGIKSTNCANPLNPKSDLFKSLNQLMFYMGYATGALTQADDYAWFVSQLEPGLEANPTVTGQVHGHQTVYVTDLRWFGAAAAIELLCIALVLPTFIGWWRLGRKVSFSPVEIAKAFEAPLLSDCNSNSSGKDIAKQIGDLGVQYGSTSDGDAGQKRLAFAAPEEVQRPEQGSYMGT